MSDVRNYWFPAKRYGWGWGFPTTWQGTAVLVAFVLLLAAGGYALLPAHGPLAFVGYSTLLCAVLVAVCWVKGEPPRWRGGER